MQFKSFQARLSVFFTVLLVLVLFTTFWVVNQKNIENAEQTILSDLEVTADAFEQLRLTRIKSLFDIVGTATRDFAFLETVSTRDKKTIASAIENNIIGRIYSLKAENVFITDLDGNLIAGNNENITQNPWPWLLIEATEHEFGEADGIVIFEEHASQVIVLPLDASGLEGWILVSFALDTEFAQATSDITKRDISIVLSNADKANITASSLESTVQTSLLSEIKNQSKLLNQTNIISLGQERYVSLAQELSDTNEGKVSILLQGSLDDALDPYERLNQALIYIFLAGLFSALLATLWMARSISKPLEQLTQKVSSIDKGDYSARTILKRKDELGTLAESVNRMAQGLEEKEQVRSLLGKVVSDEIATELLSKEVELGGEEKEVTILFSDVRNFTAMCEGAEPSDILDRLNRYFNLVSEEIELQGGVVDKYIGDAIMALYGAPVHYEDAAERSITSAIGMFRALDTINKEFDQENIPNIGMGIGINTGKVVVGNMGSENRLNYTVIGDAVNLASRLEGLTKRYGVPIIVSECTTKRAPIFAYKQIDIVRVKGKQEPVEIYTPIGLQSEQTPEQADMLDLHIKAFSQYLEQNWEQALRSFEELKQFDNTDNVADIYIKRCQSYLIDPPASDWDGIYTLTQK